MGRLTGSAFCVVAATLLPGACPAQGVFLTAGGGPGRVEANDSYRTRDTGSGSGNIFPEVAAGYAFASGLVVEARGKYGISLDIFGSLFGQEHFELKDERILAGYAFSLGRRERIRILPEIGRSFWTLDTIDRTVERRVSGEDWVWRVGAEFRMKERFGFYWSYTNPSLAFGEVSVVTGGVRLEFH